MIPLLRKLVRALLYDELAARRWLRGGFLWLGAMGTQVMAWGGTPEQALTSMRTWGIADWIPRLVIAGIIGGAGMINLGEKNATAP